MGRKGSTYGVMYRLFIDRLRRERNSPVQFGREPHGEETMEEQYEPIDEDAEPSGLAERQLMQERLCAAWTQLVEDHRVVLSMHDIEGYSLVELSELMQLPLGTVKSRLNRARTRLRLLLTKERSRQLDRVCGAGPASHVVTGPLTRNDA